MFFAAALFALPLLTQSVFAGACTRNYTIQEGDICDSISAAKNVSTYQLSAINVGVIDTTCSNLVAGKNICLGYAGEDCSTTHIVTADQSCELILSTYRINSTILYHNNPQINADCTNIYIGEVLCVAGSGLVPPAPSGGFVPGAVIPVATHPAQPAPTAAPPAFAATTMPVAAPATSSAADENLPYCDEL